MNKLFTRHKKHELSRNTLRCPVITNRLVDKFNKAPVPYPPLHHFMTEMCTCLIQNGALWRIHLMYCEICEMGLFQSSLKHYNDVIMSTMVSQMTGVSIVCWTVGSGTDQRKHQSSASPAFVRGIPRWPVNSPHKETVTRKKLPFDDVIMIHSHTRARPSGQDIGVFYEFTMPYNCCTVFNALLCWTELLWHQTVVDSIWHYQTRQ